MSKRLFFIGLLVAVLYFAVVGVAFAAYGLEETAGAAGLQQKELPALAGALIGTVLSLIGVIFFALMIYGGFLWMTAHGKEEQAKQGLETVLAAVIGLVIILAAYAITSFVFKSVGGVGGVKSSGESEKEKLLQGKCLVNNFVSSDTYNNFDKSCSNLKDQKLCVEAKVCVFLKGECTAKLSDEICESFINSELCLGQSDGLCEWRE